MTPFEKKAAEVQKCMMSLSKWRRARAAKSLPNEPLEHAISLLGEFKQTLTNVNKRTNQQQHAN